MDPFGVDGHVQRVVHSTVTNYSATWAKESVKMEETEMTWAYVGIGQPPPDFVCAGCQVLHQQLESETHPAIRVTDLQDNTDRLLCLLCAIRLTAKGPGPAATRMRAADFGWHDSDDDAYDEADGDDSDDDDDDDDGNDDDGNDDGGNDGNEDGNDVNDGNDGDDNDGGNDGNDGDNGDNDGDNDDDNAEQEHVIEVTWGDIFGNGDGDDIFNGFGNGNGNDAENMGSIAQRFFDIVQSGTLFFPCRSHYQNEQDVAAVSCDGCHRILTIEPVVALPDGPHDLCLMCVLDLVNGETDDGDDDEENDEDADEDEDDDAGDGNGDPDPVADVDNDNDNNNIIQ